MNDDLYAFLGAASGPSASNGLGAPLLLYKATLSSSSASTAFFARIYDALDAVGVQIANVGSNKTGASATGLENSTTVYGILVSLDGAGNQQVSVTGSAAQTYTDLITQINTDLTGVSCALYGGNLKFFGSTYGTGSSVAVTDSAGTASVALLTTLTGFTGLAAAVAGTVPVAHLANQAGTSSGAVLSFLQYVEADFNPPIYFQKGVSVDVSTTGDGGQFRLYYSR